MRDERAANLIRTGCCGGKSKEDCTRPPCPCNLEAWTPAEREQLIRDRRDAARKVRA